ncbi:C39 family peptidase [Bordetella sp. LUAb4]|uniref:C39 family peptidase n=1 Tax=Bordetella sp. LUAb4 TaxID=2843195 RepID=UPI001E4B9370|nr:C39 family peptidase [Bordetella sp. LUAb4]
MSTADEFEPRVRASANRVIIQDFATNFQTQQQPHWCWIATSLACAYTMYSRQQQYQSWSGQQCDLYWHAMGRPPNIGNVCSVGYMQARGNYDVAGIPTNPLKLLHIFDREVNLRNKSFPLNDVQESIDEGFPVILGLRDFRNNGHVVTVYGFDATPGITPLWYVGDPLQATVITMTKNDFAGLGVDDVFYTSNPSGAPPGL